MNFSTKMNLRLRGHLDEDLVTMNAGHPGAIKYYIYIYIYIIYKYDICMYVYTWLTVHVATNKRYSKTCVYGVVMFA